MLTRCFGVQVTLESVYGVPFRLFVYKLIASYTCVTKRGQVQNSGTGIPTMVILLIYNSYIVKNESYVSS